MSAIEGLFIAIICEQVVFHLRATAIGIYSVIFGIGYWISSRIGSFIWEAEGFGCEYTFIYSLACCALALVFSFVLLPRKYNFAVISKGR